MKSFSEVLGHADRWLKKLIVFVFITFLLFQFSEKQDMGEQGILMGPVFEENGIRLQQLGMWFLMLAPLFGCGVMRICEEVGAAKMTLLRWGTMKKFWKNIDMGFFQDGILYLGILFWGMDAETYQKEKIISCILILTGMFLVVKIVCLFLVHGFETLCTFTGIFLLYGVVVFQISKYPALRKWFLPFWMMEGCSQVEVIEGFSIPLVLGVQIISCFLINLWLKQIQVVERIV